MITGVLTHEVKKRRLSKRVSKRLRESALTVVSWRFMYVYWLVTETLLTDLFA